MTQETITSLSTLDPLPYLDDAGKISTEFSGKIGVYAIFDQTQTLQYIGYSRDIYLSLKQHLVRKPQQCYWVKVQTIARPSRTLLDEIRQAWIAENGANPIGNGEQEQEWTQAIDAKLTLTEAEKTEYNNTDEVGKIKLLKKTARRLEETLKTQLQARGVQEDIRFNPKLKEQGLLDLK